MKLKVKKFNKEAVLPAYSQEGDAALDLTACSTGLFNREVQPGGLHSVFLRYHTGIGIEIPEGYVGLLFPRSSVNRTSLIMANCVGVIDSNFRGEITLNFRLTEEIRDAITYKQGERIGQILIVPCPTIEIEEVSSLSPSNRGEKGFGSSGK